MRFILIDRLLSVEAGVRLTAHKSLSLAEEYLADHFPTFPVMPGVLMLEAMIQSAAWLVRVTEDFAHSMVVLDEARNVSYKSFVAPGNSLHVVIEAMRIDERESEFKASGSNDAGEVVKARLKLRHYNLAEDNPALATVDAGLLEDARRKFALVGGPAAVRPAPATMGAL